MMWGRMLKAAAPVMVGRWWAPSRPQTCSVTGPFFGCLDVILLRSALISEERDT